MVTTNRFKAIHTLTRFFLAVPWYHTERGKLVIFRKKRVNPFDVTGLYMSHYQKIFHKRVKYVPFYYLYFSFLINVLLLLLSSISILIGDIVLFLYNCEHCYVFERCYWVQYVPLATAMGY